MSESNIGQTTEAKDCPEKVAFNDLKKFDVVRVLNASEANCLISIEAKLRDTGERAVVILQKLPFASDSISEYFTSQANLRTLIQNDIYYNEIGTWPEKFNEIKASIIYPATESHIKKYERNEVSFVHETPLLYNDVTKVYIEMEALKKNWIFNILEHKSEVERIVCEDTNENTGFIMLPDFKWTGEQMDDLYLLSLVVRRDISSIRDLRGEHIPLLKNVYEKGVAAITEKYGVPEHKLRVYFHYQPSFYHLHVHFSSLNFDAPGTWVGKAHHIKEVIFNLENDSEYYKKATLPFTIKDNHPLRMKYESYEYFSKEKKDRTHSTTEA